MIRGRAKRNMFTVVALMLSIVMVILSLEPYTAILAATGAKLKDKYVGFEGVPVEWKYGAGENVFSYKDTKKSYDGALNASADIEVDLAGIRDENGQGSVVAFEQKDSYFSAGDSEYFEFDVNVPETAVYGIEFDYYLPTGSSDSAKRALYIDGEYPFTEAGSIEFSRFFKDEGEPVLNSIGDETRPKQITIDGWRTTGLKDTSGITSEDFTVKLSAGSHTIRLVTMKTGMYISGIRLIAPKEVRSYAEVKAEYASK